MSTSAVLQSFTLTQILLAFAVFWQHLENLRLRQLARSREGLFAEGPYRLILYGGWAASLFIPLALYAQSFLALDMTVWLFVLQSLIVFSILAVALSFGGNFNGGADAMSVQIGLALWAAHLARLIDPRAGDLAAHVALFYIAVQLGLSYFVAGLTKLKNPDWRSGRALQELARGGNYDLPEIYRELLNRPTGIVLGGAWAVLLFELLFPLSFLSPRILAPVLALGFGFHLMNYLMFGLNRFVWAWVAAYPAALYLAVTLAAG